jgi:hypothetical protein
MLFRTVCHCLNLDEVRERFKQTSTKTSFSLCSLGPLHLNLHRGAVDITVMLDENSYMGVTMCAGSLFGCLWTQIMNVVEKFRHVYIESGGEWFSFVEI